MIRTFNYTKRKKIPKECIAIAIFKSESITYFNATINLSKIGFHSDARIFVEAYYGPTVIRFDFGTVARLIQPINTDITQLAKISDKVLFRVKVVDDSQGLILGYANISIADDNNKNHAAIFYVNTVRMDTQEIWRINFEADNDGTPVLELNSAIDGIRDIARIDANFLALVFPAALRLILSRIAEINDFDRESDSWTAKWILFTEDILGIHATPTNNEDEACLQEWYNEVLKSFCLKNRLFDRYIKSL